MTDKPEAVGLISGLDALKISRDIVQAFLKASIDQDSPLTRTHYVRDMRTTLKVLHTLIQVGENTPAPDETLVIKVPNQ